MLIYQNIFHLFSNTPFVFYQCTSAKIITWNILISHNTHSRSFCLGEFGWTDEKQWTEVNSETRNKDKTRTATAQSSFTLESQLQKKKSGYMEHWDWERGAKHLWVLLSIKHCFTRKQAVQTAVSFIRSNKSVCSAKKTIADKEKAGKEKIVSGN